MEGVTKCIIFKTSDHMSWSHGNTKILIDLYKEHTGSLRHNSKRLLWEAISRDFKTKFGIHVNARHCENKWKVLERNYRKAVDNNGTGRRRKTFEFASELDGIFPKKKECKPVLLLTSSTVHRPSLNLLRPNETIPSTSLSSPSIPSTSMPSVSIPSKSQPSPAFPSSSLPSTSIPSPPTPSTSNPSSPLLSSVPSTSLPVRVIRKKFVSAQNEYLKQMREDRRLYYQERLRQQQLYDEKRLEIEERKLNMLQKIEERKSEKNKLLDIVVQKLQNISDALVKK